jgi:hypothetical protein
MGEMGGEMTQALYVHMNNKIIKKINLGGRAMVYTFSLKPELFSFIQIA